MSSTSAINSTAEPADLNAARAEETFSSQQATNFKLALAGANAVAASPVAGARPAATLSLDQSALHAADEAWVNFVAISEQLQNPNLPQEKQKALLQRLAENLRAFRTQSGPLVEQVDNFFASSQASNSSGQ
jgi:hypothetical protein